MHSIECPLVTFVKNNTAELVFDNLDIQPHLIKQYNYIWIKANIHVHITSQQNTGNGLLSNNYHTKQLTQSYLVQSVTRKQQKV